ncbi:hypothetical protein ALP20_200177 [Pseudomonas coronafaciens pv. coronafaciens]|nr:hypothetical protein ALP20_200177 [Pseudomonas coronafaciens pv. coronafaciens]
MVYLPTVSLIFAIASHLLVTDLCLQFGRLLLSVRGCYASFLPVMAHPAGWSNPM